jgi:hypothetical protein
VDLAVARGYAPSADSAVVEVGAMAGSSAWLANPPTLAISHLESDQRRGTDETEISLNFPFKSPLQRDSDSTLLELDPRLDAASERYRRWYLSGTLRDVYARYQQARIAQSLERTTAETLVRFEAQLAESLAAGAVERYDLLAVQRMRAEAEGRLERRQAEVRGALRLYRTLTGAGSFPENPGDDAPLQEEPLYAQHPQLELLALNEARDLANLRASSPAATPWNLALVGRELEIPEFSERQLGIALEIPITVGASVAPATRSSERALRRSYALQRDQQLAALRLAWQALQSERSGLLARQSRLLGSIDTADLASLIETTRRSAELPIEVRLERLLTLLDMQTAPARIAIDLKANAAAMRQLAGMSL